MILPYIKIYPDFLSVVRELDNGARGRLLLAIMQYANGEEPDELTGVERIAFIVLKGQIDRDVAVYEANAKKQSENGKKGGRPKKAEAFLENPKNPPLFWVSSENPKKPNKEKEEEKDKDKDKEEDKEKEKDKDKSIGGMVSPYNPLSTFLPPSVRASFSRWLKAMEAKGKPCEGAELEEMLRRTKDACEKFGEKIVNDMLDVYTSYGRERIFEPKR